ncbi:ABC transporter ATP-binding protein [Spirillospora sp. NPDC127200]
MRPGTRTLVAAFELPWRAAPAALAGYAVLTLVAGTLPVVTAWLTKLVVDGVIAGTALTALLLLGAGLGLAGIVVAGTPLLGHYLRAELDRRTGALAQGRLFTAVNGFAGLGRFETPAFLDRLRLAQQAMSSGPSQSVDGLLGVARALVTTVSFLGALLAVSPWLSALVLLTGAPMLVCELVMSRRRVRLNWRLGPTERMEIMYSELLSDREAAKEIRLFGTGGFFRDLMLRERRRSNTARRRLDRRELLLQLCLVGMSATVAAGGLLWGVVAVRNGTISIGEVLMFIAAVAGVQGAMGSAATSAASAHEALAMLGHYRTVVEAGPDLPVPATPRPVPELRDGIELRDVWFRYSERHPWVLRGVDLHIPRGGSMALVGLNGAGKSTLVSLLCRFYDPTRGAVLWDRVDIREFDVAELRRRIGAVFQDFMCYDLTAAENIGLGDLERLNDRSGIAAAAERAGAHEAIEELPHGYSTLLTRLFLPESTDGSPDEGVLLSGGQWQRLALARALLRERPDLMILDEPSSGLDAAAEHAVHRSLARHRAGRTSLLISHRLGTVRDADAIVVLSEGRIVERGDHASLIDSGGEYARLFKIQSNAYLDGHEGLDPIGAQAVTATKREMSPKERGIA